MDHWIETAWLISGPLFLLAFVLLKRTNWSKLQPHSTIGWIVWCSALFLHVSIAAINQLIGQVVLFETQALQLASVYFLCCLWWRFLAAWLLTLKETQGD